MIQQNEINSWLSLKRLTIKYINEHLKQKESQWVVSKLKVIVQESKGLRE